MPGWLVNDYLTTIPGTVTLWHRLLTWLKLKDLTGTDFQLLAHTVELLADHEKPDFIIRNAAFFRRMLVPVPTISLVQDPLQGKLRDLLEEVCFASDRVVFNSRWTQKYYENIPGEIIPLGVDFQLFNPGMKYPGLFPEDTVVWVGSGDPIKGPGRFLDVMSAVDCHFVVVTKDDFIPHSEKIVNAFRRVPQGQMARILASSRALICTSEMETQHLAGIEAGACGVPVIATKVGAYYGLGPGYWGEAVEKWDLARALRDELGKPLSDVRRQNIREFWMSDHSLEACEESWRKVVEEACRKSPLPA